MPYTKDLRKSVQHAVTFNTFIFCALECVVRVVDDVDYVLKL